MNGFPIAVGVDEDAKVLVHVTVVGLPRRMRIWDMKRPRSLGAPRMWGFIYDRAPWLGDGRRLECERGTKVILSPDTPATDHWLTDEKARVVCSMESTLEWNLLTRHHYLELRASERLAQAGEIVRLVNQAVDEAKSLTR